MSCTIGWTTGLTFDSVTKVTLNGVDAAETTDYTVQQDAAHTNGTTTVTDTFDVILPGLSAKS